MTPFDASKTYTVSLPVIECRNCGTRTWQGVCVLGAVGHYCKECADAVTLLARMNCDRQMADMWTAGVIRVPADPYDPKEEGKPMPPIYEARLFAIRAPHLLTDDDRAELRYARFAPLVRWGGIIVPVLCAVALIAMIWRIK